MSNTLIAEYEKVTEALLNYESPSTYFLKHINDEIYNIYPFNIIKETKNIEQNPETHKEGNVFNHTMLAIDVGAKHFKNIKNKKEFMWSVLLHDIGKIPTTKFINGKLTTYNHAQEGAKMAEKFFEQIGILDEKFVKTVVNNINCHMHPAFIVHNKDVDVKELLENCDIEVISNIAFCDWLGRAYVNEKKVAEKVSCFVEKIKK